jgi:hypothetical protein
MGCWLVDVEKVEKSRGFKIFAFMDLQNTVVLALRPG